MSNLRHDSDNGPVAALSLLSLAASQANPQARSVPRSAPTTSVSRQPYPSPTTAISPPVTSTTTLYPGNLGRGAPMPSSRGSASGSQAKPRRLSSASHKRRLSEATAATLQATAASEFVRGASVVSNSGLTAAAASLSLSSSPPIGSVQKGIQQVATTNSDEGMDEDSLPPGAKRKGTIYRCETCSKVYRHPNCLLKHRWEHSPHWREASKFLLSKHQQVQLLEAAAILSHLAPRDPDTGAGGTSLPEDRALWPSYLSGGVLAAPSTKTPTSTRSSNLTATKAKVDLTSIQTMKREESSEEELPARPHVRGITASSLPATSTFAGRHSLPQTVPLRATKSDDRPSSSSPVVPPVGSFTAETGLYYGSVGALPSRDSPSLSGHSPSLTATSPNPGGFSSHSFQASYLANQPPPYARGSAPMISGQRAGHRHTRTSSSISSSYTRSSIRGGLDEDEDDMDDDIGYLDKSSYYGGSSYNTSVSPSIPSIAPHRKTDYEFDERDEGDEDTVDEESDENQGGAGMEIDMEL